MLAKIRRLQEQDLTPIFPVEGGLRTSLLSLESYFSRRPVSPDSSNASSLSLTSLPELELSHETEIEPAETSPTETITYYNMGGEEAAIKIKDLENITVKKI